ncbi:uncharacterized protein, partial [Diadema setosum]|uniref:uncharacterized protein n=1 Tax=Diadema setosum TaxID=31175 RepID=UPI003B3AC580
MVNNAAERVRNPQKKKHVNTDVHNSKERQQLVDELSFLTNLLHQHKKKQSGSHANKETVRNAQTKFSWTKNETHHAALAKSATSVPRYSPASCSSSDHTKPEQRMKSQPSSKVSPSASHSSKQWPAKVKVHQNVTNPSLAKVTKRDILLHNEPLSSHSDTRADARVSETSHQRESKRHKKHSVCKESNAQVQHLTSSKCNASATDKTDLPCDRKPVLFNKPVSLAEHGSSISTPSSSSPTGQPTCRTVQKTRQGAAPARTVLLRKPSKDLLPGTDKTTLRKVCSKTPNQNVVPDKLNSQKLAHLAKELDKCLGDIAKLKAANTKAKLPTTPKQEFLPEGNGPIAISQLAKSSIKRKHRSGNRVVVNVCSTSQRPSTSKSNYTWTSNQISQQQPILKQVDGGQRKISTTQSLIDKSVNSTQSQSLSQGTKASTTKILSVRPVVQETSPTNVIRTKYKVKKLASLPCHRAKVGRSKHSPSVLAVKSRCQPGFQRRGRYKLVRSSSVPSSAGLPLPRPSPSTKLTSPHSLVKKTPVILNSRYKKIKGQSASHVKHRKHHVIIPHRSQLKLVKVRGKSPQLKVRKHTPHFTATRQTFHNSVNCTKTTPVIRSRYKMRKVNLQTSQKTTSKQAHNSSPFKWKAQMSTPVSQSMRESFMQRRMKYVLAHTPVLLRSRFRLVRSSQTAKVFPETGWTSRHYRHDNSSSASKMSKSPQQPLLKKTKTKIVRKAAGHSPGQSQDKAYNHGVVSVKGVRYHRSSSGKSLCRISSQPLPLTPSLSPSPVFQRAGGGRRPSFSRVWTSSAHKMHQQSTPRVSSTQWMANRVLRRTIQSKINRDSRSLKTQPYCKFYNRYGRCHRGSKCPYIHDPEKVAVCTQFLRGTCQRTDGTCPFSHKVSKDKMPVCVYFLKGVCNRDNCPYSHVKVSKRAEVCQEFLQGYCPRGEKCKKKHTLECAEFNETGQCKRGNKCPLWHRKARRPSRDGRKGAKRRSSDGDSSSSRKRYTHPKKPRNKQKGMTLGNDALNDGNHGNRSLDEGT